MESFIIQCLIFKVEDVHIHQTPFYMPLCDVRYSICGSTLTWEADSVIRFCCCDTTAWVLPIIPVLGDVIVQGRADSIVSIFMEGCS